MEPSRLGPNFFGYRCRKCQYIVTQFCFKLINAFHGKSGACTQRGRSFSGDNSRTCERLGRRKLHAQPVFIPVAFGPDRGHLRTGVTGNHWFSNG